MPAEKPIPRYQIISIGPVLPGYGHHQNHGGVIEYRTIVPSCKKAIFVRGDRYLGSVDPNNQTQYYEKLRKLRKRNPDMTIANPTDLER